MDNALIYIRFSTTQQERGDSRRRQLEDCRAWCANNGLQVIEVVEDLGRSAYKGDHLSVGNLGKLTQRIMRGEYAPGTTLVVEKMDRLSREKPRFIRRWIEDVTDKGLRIVRVSGGPVIDSAYLDDGANMQAVIDMAWENNASHQFSQNISDRLSKSWQERRKRSVERKGLLTASVPRWLRAVGAWDGKNSPDHRSFEIIPERGATVLRIYQLAADGVGTWGIAKHLNNAGVANWGKVSATTTQPGWNHTTVLNILTSSAVEGIHYPTHTVNRQRVRTGDVLRDYFPIIDGMTADLVARARAQLSKRAGGSPKSNFGKNLLASLAKCGECGGFMVMRNRSASDGPYSYLQCDNASKAKGCSAKGMFNYRVLEPAILDAVLHLTLDDSFFSMADRATELRVALAELDRKLEIVRADRDSARALYIRHADDPEFEGDWRRLSDTARTMEGERMVLAAQLAEASGEISPSEHLRRVHNFRTAMDDEDVEVRRTARLRVRDAFRTVLDQVVCHQRMEGGDLVKWMDIHMARGLIGVRFDNAGAVLWRWDYRNSPDHIHGLTAGEMAENKAEVEAISRRPA